MLAEALDAPYDHLLSRDVVSEVVRLLRADRLSHGVTSLVLSLEVGPRPSLMDLEGLGSEIWADEDAQEYVSRLRDEWGR